MLYALLGLLVLIVLYCIYKIKILSYRIKILYITLIALTYGIQKVALTYGIKKGDLENGFATVPILLKFHGLAGGLNNIQDVFVTWDATQNFIMFHPQLFQESKIFAEAEKYMFK